MSKAIPWQELLTWGGVLGLIGWAARHLPWAATWQVLRGIAPLTALALIVLNAAILWLFALRWWWLLRLSGYPVAWWRLTLYRLAAFSVSYFTPGSQFGGEPLQVLAVYRRHGVPLPVATAGVALDKLLELVGNFGFVLFAALLWTRSGAIRPAGRWGVLLGSAALVGGVSGYLVGICRGARPLTRLGRGLPWLPRLTRGLAQTEGAVHRLCRHKGVVAGGLALSLPVWAALFGEYVLLTRALGLTLAPQQILLLMLAARLAFLLPLLPGSLGTLEAAIMGALQMLGHPPAVGLALTLLLRLRDFITGATGLLIARGIIGTGPFTSPSS